MKLIDIIEFDPSEKIKKGRLTKKISMENLIANEKFIDGYEIKKFDSGSKFRNEDILFARITPCLENGKTSKVTILDQNEIGYGSTEFIVLRGKKNTNSDFVYYLSRSNIFRAKAIKCMEGTSGRKRVNEDALKLFEMDLPNTVQQKKISEFLNCFDEIIKNNIKINFLLNSIIKQIFSYWFTQFDFPNQEGLPYKSNGGKMKNCVKLNIEIPVNWKTGKFEDILDELECGDRPGGGVSQFLDGVPSIGAENILGIGKYEYGSEKFTPVEYFEKMKMGKVKSNDVLMYKDGASLGRVSMFKNNFPYEKCSINSHVFILRSKNMVSQNYLYYWLDQDFIKKLIISIGRKAAQPGINQDDVKGLPILIPDQKTIINFDNLINSKIDMIFNNSTANRKLSLDRNWYLNKLVNKNITIS
jgi:type I restriction enzyme S subunit